MPEVWLVDAYRTGERGQVRALVEALGWPCKVKELDYRKYVVMPHVFGQTSIRGLTSAAARSLLPPWPDLIISCGVRNEPVCRWIRSMSGGHTRYLHVGRPWGRLNSFDLVITTPQYRVPDVANVVNNKLTLHSVSKQRLEQARSQWASQFEAMPTPRIGVFVGGDSGPFTLGAKAANRLARKASEAARDRGGSLLVTTSARTSETAAEALQASLDAPNKFFRWQPNSAENPYMGMLAWSDNLIVTADSIGMLSEACSTGNPVQMFDIGGMRDAPYRPAQDFRLGATAYGALLRWGWKPLTRDITLVHRNLVDSGCVEWFDDTLSVTGSSAEVCDLRQAVAAVQKLMSAA